MVVIEAVSAVNQTIANMRQYPLVFVNINKYFVDLPDDVQNEISSFTSKPMDAAAAARVLELIEPFVCDQCRKLQTQCKCGDGIRS